MAKSLLLRVLRDTFGHMVEGLESDNLQVAVWSGEISLENLSLKKDALDGLQDLPLEIKCGRVKSLKISVPWTRLGSEPVKVVIDGIYALAVLKPTQPSSSLPSAAADDFLKRRKNREKKRMLRAAALTENVQFFDDEQQLHQHDPNKGDAVSEEEPGFWTRLFSKVVDNLVVEVRHIHIRIEDHALWTNRHFSLGVSLSSFSATTCDSKGRSTFVVNQKEFGVLHRMVKVEDLCIYLDPNPPSPTSNRDKSDEYWIGFLHASEFSIKHNVRTHSYLLQPCSPSVLVSKNDLPSVESPRWEFNVKLDNVHVGVSRSQFQDVVAVHLALERQIVNANHSRPLSTPSKNPRAWWRFAIRSVILENRIQKERFGWLSLCTRVVSRKKYIALYKRTKKREWLEPLNDAELEQIKKLEEMLELSDVLAFRATALAQVKAEAAKGLNPYVPNPAKPNNPSWLRSFLGGAGNNADAKNSQFALSEEEKREIELAMNYFEASQQVRVSEQTLNIVLKSSMENATISLVSEQGQEILFLSVGGQLVVESCVGASSKTSFHLTHFELQDRFNRDTIFPVLVAPMKQRTRVAEQAGSVLNLVVEIKPPGKREDVAVTMTVSPFKIFLVSSWVGAVSSFFAISEEQRLGEVQYISEWTESKQEDLMEALARRTLISLHVQVERPVLICPLFVTRAKRAEDFHSIVLGLERLTIDSDDSRLNNKHVQEENVDAWRLQSQNVRAYLVPAQLLLMESEENEIPGEVLFHDFGFEARLAICITPKLLQVAKTRLGISTTALELKAPPSLFRFANKLGTSWSRMLAGGNVKNPPPTPTTTLTRPDGYSSPMFEIELNVAALITTLSVERSNTPLARLELKGFSLKHVRKANGHVDSLMRLQSLEVFDLYSFTPPILATSIFETAAHTSEQQMISILIEYRGLETRLTSTFHQLHVNWNPETVLAYKDAYHTSTQQQQQEEEDAVAIASSTTLVVPPPPPLAHEKYTLKVQAQLNYLSLALCKGSAGRVLAECVVSNAQVEVANFEQQTQFKFSLGNFRTSQPLVEGGETFEFFGCTHEAASLFTFEYQTRESESSLINVSISPARLVYANQMMLELIDYVTEGVMGTILNKATDTLTAPTDEKFELHLVWAKPQIVLPCQVKLQSQPEMYLAFVCEEIQASNSFILDAHQEWVSHFYFQANNLAISGNSLSELIKSPVNLSVEVAYKPQTRWKITGHVSPIFISLTRDNYFLFHRMLRENILADATKKKKPETAVATSGSVVSYGYDRDDNTPTTFEVSIFFSSASLQIAENAQSLIATFAMRRTTLTLCRMESNDPTTTKLAVEVLDLVDNRPESVSRCFRHLMLSSPSENKSCSFEILYIGALGVIEIDLHMFRSVVLLDLFFHVLNFITTTNKEDDDKAVVVPIMEEDEKDDDEVPTPPVVSVGWKGKFRLREASMFLVVDLENPDSECIVLGGDLDLSWIKSGDGCNSTWKGTLPNYQLYRATMPRATRSATDEESALALMEEIVGHQITEPCEASVEYVYEFDLPSSKIHSRRFLFQMEQLENFLSISDMQTLQALGKSMALGDANKKLHRKSSSLQECWGIHGVCIWSGSLAERIKEKDGGAPPRILNDRFAVRKAVSNRHFSVEIASSLLPDIEFGEQEGGFVGVLSLREEDSVLANLLLSGDVLVAVGYTPVLNSSLAFIRSVLKEEEKNPTISLTFHPVGCKAPLVLKDSWQFESKAVLLHVVDDIQGRDLPLVHLSFTRIDVFRNSSNVAGNSTVVGASLLLAMHYYDLITGKWEMLMSPWTASLGIQWHSHGQVECTFETENELKFQLSDVFVRASADAFRRVRKLQSSSSSSPMLLLEEDGKRSAFLLRNRTGLSLFYQVANEGKKSEVHHEETISFCFHHEQGSGSGTRRSFHKRASDRIQIDFGEVWEQLPDIQANLVHRGSVTLAAKAANHSPPFICVCWEVNLEDGRLCLELRSFRQVVNRLQIPIQVFAKNPLGGSPSTTLVLPGQTASLPILSGDVDEIRFRPVLSGLEGDFHWSEPCYVALATQRGSSNVTSLHPVSNVKPFLLHVQAEVQEADGVTILFSVYPPIVVQNQLPASMVCRFFFDRRPVGNDVLLSPGGYSHVHSVTVEGANSFVSFRLFNAKDFTPAIRVERKRQMVNSLKGSNESVSKRIEEITHVSVMDGDGTVVLLSVVQETTEYEGIRFVVFSPLWLVNKTSLPLSYGYAQNQWSSITRSNTSCPDGVMLFSNPEESGGKLQVRVSDEFAASAPFSVNAPDGKSRQVVVPGGMSYSFDLSVSVDVGPGELFRTNVVTFAPRYMFLNRLPNGTKIFIRQLEHPGNALEVDSNCREPFWASAATRIRPFRLQISALHPGTTWSNPFVLETLVKGRAIRMVELPIIGTNPVEKFRFNLEVREDQIAGSIDVDISEWVQAAPVPLVAVSKEEEEDDGEVVVVPLPVSNKRLVTAPPATVATFTFPKVEVFIRRDSAAKQTKIVPPRVPPGKPVMGTTASSSLPLPPRSLPPNKPLPVSSSSISVHPPPPPPPLPAGLPLGVTPMEEKKKNTTTHGRNTKEIAWLVITQATLKLTQRVDSFREFHLTVKELNVWDPYPQAPFPDAFEGRNMLTNTANFLELHVIQKASVFELFKLKLPEFKLKVDERFVLDLAKYASETVVSPPSKVVLAVDENDCSMLINDILSLNRTMTATTQEESNPPSSTLIFFERFYISQFDIRLWYHQVKKPKHRSLVSFGLLSKFNIKIANNRIKFSALSLVKPFGSTNLYWGIIKDHYETEGRSQLGSLLMSSFDFTSAPLVLADTLYTKILGSEVKSTEFRGESLSNEEILTKYSRKLLRTQSLDGFVLDVVRNCVFDWSYNHTGWLNSRRALVIGVVNRSREEVSIQCQLSRGQTCNAIPGGHAARQLSPESVRIVPSSSGSAWDTSSTCLILACGFFSEKVTLTCKSNAFMARFDHTEHQIKSKVGFSAAFLAKDKSEWLSWYVLMIEDQVDQQLPE